MCMDVCFGWPVYKATFLNEPARIPLFVFNGGKLSCSYLALSMDSHWTGLIILFTPIIQRFTTLHSCIPSRKSAQDFHMHNNNH